MYNDNDNNNNLILIVYLFLQNRYTEHILRKEKFSYWWCPRTLTGIALDWFSGLRDGPITSFEEFSRQFVAQLAANKQSPPSKTDLFDVRQQQRESLKDFLAKFNGVLVWVSDPDEQMAVEAVCKGLRTWQFQKSLVRRNPTTMAELSCQATCHIEVEETMERKRARKKKKDVNSSSASKPITKDYLWPKLDWNKRSDGRNKGSWRGQEYPERLRVVAEVMETIPWNTTRKAILKDVNSTRLLDHRVQTNR